jgi:hypothetical protein
MAREGRHYRYKHLEFWAQGGLITIIDRNRAGDSEKQLDEYAQRMPPRDFIKRAIAARITGKDFYPSEDHLLTRMLEDATAAVKEALAQGDPTDPAVQEHTIKHKSRRSILLPGEVDSILGPVGGAKFKFASVEPTQVLQSGETVVPDFSIGPADMITPKKAAAIKQAQATKRARA